MPKLKLNFIKKLSLILLSSLLFLNSLSLPLTALAAPNPPGNPSPIPSSAPTTSTSSWYNQGFASWYSKVFDNKNPSEIFGERYTAAQVQWIIYGLLSLPLNFISQGNEEAVSCSLKIMLDKSLDVVTCATGVVNTFKNVLAPLGFLTDNQSVNQKNPLAIVFDTSERSVSGIKYTKDFIQKFSFVPAVNAQSGFGYSTLGTIQTYWAASRNVSYALVVLIVIVFAFMIMFRVKISPQVVISVQSTLPKLFVALILITFSYAIAGFMIDLIYVVGGLLASLAVGAGLDVDFASAYDHIMHTGGTQALGSFYILVWMLGYAVAFVIAVLWAMIAALVSLSAYGFLASTFALLIAAWVVVLIIIYTIRVPWVLIKNLISIYFSIIIAPLQILMGTVAPNFGFGAWFKKLMAELLVFPLTGLLMFLAIKFLIASFEVSLDVFVEGLFSSDGTLPGQLWSPPIIGSADITGLLFLLMSFTMITLIPKAVDILKMVIMGEKFAFGTAIGEAMGPIQGPLKFAGGALQEGIGKYAGAPIINTLRTDIGAYTKFRDKTGKFGDAIDSVLVKLEDILKNRK